MKRVKQVTPIIISGLLLVVLAFYAPWPQVFKTFANLNLTTIILLIALSLAYYLIKTARFWCMMRAIDIRRPFWVVALSYMSAQPITLLPGGEIYRSKTLEKFTGVPMKRSISQFTTQGVLEGLAMATVSFVTVMTTDALRLPFLAAALVVLIAFFVVQKGGLIFFHRPINKLPFVTVSKKAVADFSKANQKILARKQLPLLLGLSIAGELVGIAIAYVAVFGVGGEVTIAKAVLLYIVPTIASFVSLLPAGLGVAEHTSVAILALGGASTAVAVAATLVMRVTIVVFGLLYGAAINTFGKILLARKGSL